MKNTQLSLFPDYEPPQHVSAEQRFGDYANFVDKFKGKKTTDDCYTPEPVYDCVLEWIAQNADIRGREIVRPFYPDGDFEHYDYPEGCVVIDNPPFSIYAKIVRFYKKHNIDFFLFAPSLTQFVVDADVCYIITMADITYANGAVVRTSFTTNLFHDTRLWVNGELKKRLGEAQKKEHQQIIKVEWPANFLTAGIMGKVVERDVSFKVAPEECRYVRNIDMLKDMGKSVFGGGFVLNDDATSRKTAAERAAAERNERVVVSYSEREKGLYFAGEEVRHD